MMLKSVLSGLTAWLLIVAMPSEALTTDEVEKMFVHQVFPLLQTKCFVCHGDDPADIRGNLDLTRRQNMIDRQALIPGQAQQSRLYQSVTWQDKNLQMPPKVNDRLTAEQIDLIRQWIEADAPWPKADRWQTIATSPWETESSGILVKTSGGLTDEWSNHRYQPADLWAFQPISHPHLPTDAPNPVDAFINQKLAQAKIAPASRADKLTLIRRATFDLIGLPPTPVEVSAFLADNQPGAFERVVDRLLADSGYGEQWGRQWLDVVRYADTSGFANDFERPNAWRYRDYVIRSFNQDKPYDQFVREQLAGDEINPDDPEMRVAVGFLRMGPWEHTMMSVAAETRQFYLDDVTNAVGEAFLSLPLQCARCHDHKFDPIPTQDYYRLQAIFASVQFADRDLPYLPQENHSGFETGRKRIQQLIDQAKSDKEDINQKARKATREWMEARGLEYQAKNKRNKLPINQRPPRHYGLSPEDIGLRFSLDKRTEIWRWQLDRYQPIAFSIYNGPLRDTGYRGAVSRLRMPTDLTGEIQPTYILSGGSVHAPGQQVMPGTLSAVQSLTPVESRPIDFRNHHRRTQIANWITHPENPLTSRSIANRIWQHYFGIGLAGNANNFGKMGKKPTHPQLLDWLARYLVENDWSLKKLHRLIMLSQTYQRSSTHPQPDLIEQRDAENQLLSYFRPRRLRAEELRDSMLAVSGDLNREMGGLPIRPEINLEVAFQPRNIMGMIALAYQPSATPQERHRRTIYAYRYRGLSDPMLEVFNQPPADKSCELRTVSTIVPQAFTLFNSQNSRQRALAMALRLTKERSQLQEKIQTGIQLAWCRPAQPDEVKRGLEYIKKMTIYHQQNRPLADTYPTSLERTRFDEVAGETFTYTEQLDIYQQFTPDPQLWTVSDQVLALADFCLLLLNANEFIYIY